MAALRLAALASPALAGAIALTAGCPQGAEPRVPGPETPAPAPARPRSPAYVLADPDALHHGQVLPLEGGAVGLIGGAIRGVLPAGGEMRLAPEVVEGLIARAERIPEALGGGFLFSTGKALYQSPTFDGPLRPLIGVARGIERISFGPAGALVRAGDGHRFATDLRSGALQPIAPPGLADVASLPDGRAAALAEGPRLFVTADRGVRWIDATAALGDLPASVAAHGGEIWIATKAGRSYRLDAGGSPREVGRIPPPPAEPIRPRPPEWHGAEPPLVAAVRRGAPAGEGAAIVAAGGDVARVDIVTGAVTILSAGRLPPDLPCEALRAGDDVIAVCAAPGRPSVVVSHLLSNDPVIERTIPGSGRWYAGDEGSIVFGGSCDGAKGRLSACARDRRGAWSEPGPPPPPDAGAGPAGAPAPPAPKPKPGDIARWVPRPSGPPLAITGGKAIDFAGGTLAWSQGGRPVPPEVSRAGTGNRILDFTWSASADGALRGWIPDGRIVTVTPDGQVSRSAFRYAQLVDAGLFALAFAADGRAFQTTDGGRGWTAVPPPPLTPAAWGRTVAPPLCSAVGCVLGDWIRVGWDAARPAPAAEPRPAPAVPGPPHSVLREIACSPAGPERGLSVLDPEGPSGDLGLGARRLKVAPPASDRPIDHRRRFFGRSLVDPLHGLSNRDVARGARALAHGYFAARRIDPNRPDAVVVLGPSRGIDAYRLDLDALEPFDAEGRIRSTSLGVGELRHVAGAMGIDVAGLFDDGLQIEDLVPVVPADPEAPTALVAFVWTEAGGLFGTLAGGGSPALKIAGARVAPGQSPVAAVELPGGEIAVLTAAPDGRREVLSVRPGGVSLRQQVAFLPDKALAPANPDALAVGPDGALALLHTPSGSDPPSEKDPALIYPLSGAPPLPLAPWSTLTADSDPACRAEAGGFRAIVQTAGPWVSLLPLSPDRSTLTGAMRARVRWTAHRVCLEAIEIPDGLHPARGGGEVETTVVVRFTGKPAAARLGFGPGAELRQPLACTLSPG